MVSSESITLVVVVCFFIFVGLKMWFNYKSKIEEIKKDNNAKNKNVSN